MGAKLVLVLRYGHGFPSGPRVVRTRACQPKTPEDGFSCSGKARKTRGPRSGPAARAYFPVMSRACASAGAAETPRAPAGRGALPHSGAGADVSAGTWSRGFPSASSSSWVAVIS